LYFSLKYHHLVSGLAASQLLFRYLLTFD